MSAASDPMESVAPEVADTNDSNTETGATTVSGASGQADIEPLTLPLIGKMFGVPLIIIGVIVGGAIVVVLLFGAPSSTRKHDLNALLQSLEASQGQKQMGMLLPREKEHWQAGLELTRRLHAGEFDESQLDEIATRLARLVTGLAAELKQRESASGAVVAMHKPAVTRAVFLIRALGGTRRPQAIAPLVAVVRTGDGTCGVVAIEQLGGMVGTAGLDRAIEPILDALSDSAGAEIRLVASTVLSLIAEPTDRRVIEKLSEVRLANDGELAWSAALALARLGSNAGKSTLLDLLDRSFWESGDRYQTIDGQGSAVRYKMPPQRIDHLLIAAVDAAENLGDRDLWEMMERLKSDTSPIVSSRAARACKERTPRPSAATD